MCLPQPMTLLTNHFRNSNRETQKSKIKCAGREATGGIEVFTSMEHFLPGRILVASEGKGGAKGGWRKKVKKLGSKPPGY